MVWHLLPSHYLVTEVVSRSPVLIVPIREG